MNPKQGKLRIDTHNSMDTRSREVELNGADITHFVNKIVITSEAGCVPRIELTLFIGLDMPNETLGYIEVTSIPNESLGCVEIVKEDAT